MNYILFCLPQRNIVIYIVKLDAQAERTRSTSSFLSLWKNWICIRENIIYDIFLTVGFFNEENMTCFTNHAT